MDKLILLGVAALVLTGCKDETPPFYVNDCIERQTVTTLTPVFINNQVIMIPNMHHYCVKSVPRCIWGKDYTGEKTCDKKNKDVK